MKAYYKQEEEEKRKKAEEEKAKADKVFEGMINKGLIRYTTQRRANRKAGGSCNYHLNMILK